MQGFIVEHGQTGMVNNSKQQWQRQGKKLIQINRRWSGQAANKRKKTPKQTKKQETPQNQ